MMRFEKVPMDVYVRSRKEWKHDWEEEDVKKWEGEWKNIKLPQRATDGSAGYDFFIPYDTDVSAIARWSTIPTGVRWVTDRNDVCMAMIPRSGLGFRNKFRLANTVGLIDSDYCSAINFGHIMAKVTADEAISLKAGDAFMQGVILPFIKVDDDSNGYKSKRVGGFGSTSEGNNQ